MKTYNHAFTFGFAVPGSTSTLGDDLSALEIREAILNALARIPDDELVENVGAPFNTFMEQ